MDNITITDLFGNKLSKNKKKINNLPFILIYTVSPINYLIKITGNKNSSIWRINNLKIADVLHKNNINPFRFYPLGDIFFQDKLLKNKILILVNINKRISTFPTDFIKLGTSYRFGIWKPVGPNGYRNIGLIASKNKPDIKSMRLVNKEFLINYRDKSNVINNLTNMNEFNLLSYKDKHKFTINRIKFLSTNKNKNKKLNKKNYQKINYSVQGELKMDNECIGVSMDDNIRDNYVYLKKCNVGNQQKWFPYNNHFISQFDGSYPNMDKYNKYNEICKREGFKTDINRKINKGDNIDWKTKRGKKVMLIEAENPWYSDKQIQSNNLDKTDRECISKLVTDNIQNSEDKSKLDSLIEKFDAFQFDKGKSYINFTSIAVAMLTLTLTIILIRFYLRKK